MAGKTTLRRLKSHFCVSRSIRKFYVPVLVWLFLIWPGYILALSTAPMTFDQLLLQSDFIFVGTIKSKHVEWADQDKKRIISTYEIEINTPVINELKDSKVRLRAETKNTISLQFDGGEIGEIGYIVNDVPQFETGDNALFFIDEEAIGTVTPLTGVNRGLYGIETDAAGKSIVVPFVNNGQDGFYNINRTTTSVFLDDFIQETKTTYQALQGEIRSSELNAEWLSRNIPPATFNGKAPISSLNKKSVFAQRTERFDFGGFKRSAPITFDYRPYVKDNAALWKEFTGSLSYWNVYADVFRYGQSGKGWANNNSQNDFVFLSMSNSDVVRNYGQYTYGTLGFCTTWYNTETKYIIESDVVVFTDYDWGYGWDQVWSQGKQNLYCTLLHEFGHSFGRKHTFEENDHYWLSVLDYFGSGGSKPYFQDDFYIEQAVGIIFQDDARSIRTQFPASAKAVADCGYFPFYITETDNNIHWASFPREVIAGKSFTVGPITIENIGTKSMTPEWTWQLVANYPSLGGTRYNCGIGTYGTAQPAGEWKRLNSTVTVPANVPPGKYTLCIAGKSDDVGWNNNNYLYPGITVKSAKPDLVDAGESARSFSPTTLYPGETISVNCQISNIGGGNAASSFVDFYAINIDDNNIFYPLGQVSVPALASGAKSSCNLQAIMPSNAIAGRYFIGWIIDSLGSVDESDESNNYAGKEGYYLTVEPIPLPDLTNIFDASFSPSIIYPEDPVVIQTNIINLGNLSADPYSVEFYAVNSQDATVEYKLGNTQMPSLPSNEYTTCSITCRFPENAELGQYYLKWCIDPDKVIEEINETNNLIINVETLLNVNRRPQPDLTFTVADSVMTVKRRIGRINGNLIVANSGNEKAAGSLLTMYMYNSQDDGLIYLKAFPIPSLLPGESIMIQPGVTTKGKKKPKLRPDKYKFTKGFDSSGKYLVFMLDASNEVVELDEDNNTFISSFITVNK